MICITKLYPVILKSQDFEQKLYTTCAFSEENFIKAAISLIKIQKTKNAPSN